MTGTDQVAGMSRRELEAAVLRLEGALAVCREERDALSSALDAEAANRLEEIALAEARGRREAEAERDAARADLAQERHWRLHGFTKGVTP